MERQNETRAIYREGKRERETKKRGKGRKWKRNLSGDSLPSFACIRICRLSGDHGIGLAVVAVVVVVVRPLAVPSTWSMAIERSSCRLPRCWQVVQASGAGAAVWIAGRQESLGESRRKETTVVMYATNLPLLPSPLPQPPSRNTHTYYKNIHSTLLASLWSIEFPGISVVAII